MIYLFSGDDEIAIRNAINKLGKAQKIQSEDIHIYRVGEGLSWAEIFDDLDGLPFFSEHKLVVIRGDFTKKIAEHEQKMLLRYLDNPSPYSDLVFDLNGANLDKRLSITKTLLKKTNVQTFVLKDRISMASIRDIFKKAGQKISDEALAYLLNACQNDSWYLKNCIDILLTYGQDVDLKLISQMIERHLEDDIFNLTNAIFENKTALALKILQDFKKRGLSPFYILATLASQFRFLNVVKILRYQEHFNTDLIAEHLKAKPYRITMSLKNLEKLKGKDLLYLLSSLSKIDQELKSSTLLDQYIYLELYIMRLLNAGN